LQNNKKHIVIVSIWYPPIVGVAVNRIHAFSKYLNKDKYPVSVITLWKNGLKEFEQEEEISIYRVKNKSFLKLPHFDKKVPKVIHYLKVVWKLFVIKIKKDEFESWTSASLKKLIEINKRNPIDVILSSYSPIAPHLAALNFIKRNPSVKWIADMRDEMSRNPFLTNNFKTKYKKIETEINQYATALTTVSKPILDDFKTDFTSIKHFAEIRNGFDNDFLIENKNHSFNEILTFLYAGTFYGKRKPTTFLLALNNLKEQNKLPAKWVFKLIGSANNFDIPNTLKEHIIFIDKLPQKECEVEMKQADINVFIHPNMGVKGVYTGKLFDYLSTLKPILAITDKEDVAAQLIRELNAGYIADFDNIPEIEEMITLAVENWKNKKMLEMDVEGIKKLHRSYQVKKLEELIEQL